MKQRINTYRRLKRSFLLAVLLPGFIFLGYLFHMTIIETGAMIFKQKQKDMAKYAEILEDRLSELQSIASQASLNSKLTSTFVSSGPLSVREAIEELSKFKSGNSFITEIILWYPGMNELISDRGTITTDAFVRIRLGGRIEHVQQMNTILETDKTSFTPQQNLNMYIYTIAVPIQKVRSQGKLIFIIPEKSMLQIQPMIMEGDSIYISDKAGEILFKSNLQMNESILNSDKQFAIIWQNGLLFRLFYESSKSSFRFVVVVPLSKLIDDLRINAWLNAGAVVILLLFAKLLSIYLASNNFGPVQNLYAFTRNLFPGAIANENKDELICIRDAVLNVAQQNNNLSIQVDNQRTQLGRSLLLQLLQGGVENVAEWKKTCQQIGIFMKGPNYCAVAIKTLSDDIHAGEKLIDLLVNTNAEIEAHALLSINTEIVVCSIGRTTLDELANTVHCLHLYYPDAHVGIGQFYQDVVQLSLSCIEARTALEVSCKQNETRLTIYTPQDYLVRNFVTQERLLYHSLCQGNKSIAENVLRELILRYKTYYNTSAMLKYSYSHLIQIIISVVPSDVNIYDYEIDNAWQKCIEATEMNLVELIEEKSAILVGLVCDLSTKISAIQVEKQNTDVLEYIKENYKNPGMCLDLIAGQFGFSYAFWSANIKESIGINFSDYLWSLRLTEAKRLLSESDLSIGRIVQVVGYTDASSFIKRFRLIEGITPGVYRQLHFRSKKGINL